MVINWWCTHSVFSSGPESLHSSRANCGDEKGKRNGTHPIGLPRKKHSHSMYRTLCRLKTSIICVLIPKVSEQIMSYAAQHRHAGTPTHTHYKISEEKVGGCHKATWFSEGTLVVMCHQKASMQGPFLSWSWKHLPACLPGEMHDAEQRWCSIFLKKLHRELWLGHLGGQGKSQANMSASHTDSGRSTSFFLYARITCVHVLGKAVQQEQWCVTTASHTMSIYCSVWKLICWFNTTKRQVEMFTNILGNDTAL